MLDQKLKERILSTDPAAYGHFPGVRFMLPRIKPVDRRSKVVGPAYTVRMMGKDSACLYRAIELAPAGSVLVIDRCGDPVYACVGEFVARWAKSRGIAGIVIDGTATDSLALEDMDFPVFCTGISVVTTNVWGITGEYDTEISCGGALVRPGDLIFGDADGVVVLPPEDLTPMLEKAEAAAAREAEMRRQFAAGETPAMLQISVAPLFETDLSAMIREVRSGKRQGPKK